MVALRLDGGHSERVDALTGVTERALFLGPPNSEVFTITYVPGGRLRGLALLSSSLLADRVRTYRAEVEVARSLAAEGMAVARYDYRGFGHSGGVSGQATFDGMLEDLAIVRSEMMSRFEGLDEFHMGIRFGAVVAAAGAERFGGDVVLWEPALSGRAYFREAFRAHMIGRLTHEENAATPQSQLDQTGRAEVLGYTVTEDLRSSAGRADLANPISARKRSVLWLSFGEDLAKREQTIVDGWRADGLDVETATIAIEDSTWFIGARPIVGDEVVRRTTDWMRGRLR